MPALRLSDDAGSLRYLLHGRSVQRGDLLELLLDDGTWLPVRFDWSGEEEERPSFLVALAAETEASLPPLVVPPDAILRWPEDRDRSIFLLTSNKWEPC